MAIGWITVLKLVPWGDVIKNAPVIADGAKKLWDTVGRKPLAADGSAPPGASPGRDLATAPARQDVVTPTQVRLAEAEASIAQLHKQMQASSALIKAMAEQNTVLIKRVELNRVRTWWLAGLLLVFGVIAALSLALALSGNG